MYIYTYDFIYIYPNYIPYIQDRNQPFTQPEDLPAASPRSMVRSPGYSGSTLVGMVLHLRAAA